MERMCGMDVSHTVSDVCGSGASGTRYPTLSGALTVPALVPTMHRHPVPVPANRLCLGSTSATYNPRCLSAKYVGQNKLFGFVIG